MYGLCGEGAEDDWWRWGRLLVKGANGMESLQRLKLVMGCNTNRGEEE